MSEFEAVCHNVLADNNIATSNLLDEHTGGWSSACTGSTERFILLKPGPESGLVVITSCYEELCQTYSLVKMLKPNFYANIQGYGKFILRANYPTIAVFGALLSPPLLGVSTGNTGTSIEMQPLNPTFETLPSDIILDILCSFSTFRHLYALISSSPTSYRIFNEYSASILACIAKKTLDENAWEMATKVLVYQRHSEHFSREPPNLNAVKKDLTTEFSMQRRDVVQLTANQRFFNVLIDRPEFEKDLKPSVPAKIFYQIWLLSLRFTYDTVEEFTLCELLGDSGSEPSATSPMVMGIRSLRIIFVRSFFYAGHPILWIWWFINLFDPNLLVWRQCPSSSGKDLLRLKMLCHILDKHDWSGDGIEKRFISLLDGFTADCRVMSTAEIVEKHGLLEAGVFTAPYYGRLIFIIVCMPRSVYDSPRLSWGAADPDWDLLE